MNTNLMCGTGFSPLQGQAGHAEKRCGSGLKPALLIRVHWCSFVD